MCLLIIICCVFINPVHADIIEGTLANSAEMALGENSKADGDNAIAIGDTATVNGYIWLNPILDGENNWYTYNPTLLSSANSIAYGTGTYVIGENSVAIGVNASINKINSDTSLWNKPSGSIAIGEGAVISTYTTDVAIPDPDEEGSSTTDTVTVGSNNSIVIGALSNLSNDNSVAIGSNNTSSGANSVILGTGNSNNGANSIIIGSDSYIDATRATETNIILGNDAHISTSSSGKVANTLVVGNGAYASPNAFRSTSTINDSIIFGPQSHASQPQYGANVVNPTTLSRSIAFGIEAYLSTTGNTSATLQDSIAFGPNARVTMSGVNSSGIASSIIALGSNASVGVSMSSSETKDLLSLGSNVNLSAESSSDVNLIGSNISYNVNPSSWSNSAHDVVSIGSNIEQRGSLSSFTAIGSGTSISSGRNARISSFITIGSNNTFSTSGLTNSGNSGGMSNTVVIGSGNTLKQSTFGSINRSVIFGSGANITTKGYAPSRGIPYSAGVYDTIVIGTAPNITVTASSDGGGTSLNYSILLGSNINITAEKGNDISDAISIGRSSSVSNSYAIAIGSYSEANNYSAIAIGNSSSTNAGSAIAMGSSASASAASAIALGSSSQASNSSAIAIGSNANSSANSALAIGSGASATASQAVAIGESSMAIDSYTVSIGRAAYIDDTGTSYNEITRRLVNVSAGINDTDAVNISQLKKQGTDIASALGGTSSYTFNSSDGTGALATGLEVGGRTYTSVQDALNAIDGGTGGGSALSVNYDDESKETVTLGNTSGGTTVTNVKAGELSETSTDAVNGSQLYETNQNLASLDGLAVKYDNESKTRVTLGNGTDKVSIKNVADGVDANDAVNKSQLDAGIADAKASGKWNLKVNDSAAEEISGGKIVTLKDGTNVAITKDAEGNYVFSTVAAPEFDAVTIRNTNISINSDGIDMGDKKIINLQRGDVLEGSSDAVTGGQLYETNQTIQQLDASSVKYDADSEKTKITLEGTGGTTITNVKAGELSETSTDAVNGSQLYATNKRVGDLETNVGDITTNLSKLDGLAVKYDDETKTSITLGNGTDNVTIKNVADGVDDNDAVNKGQLDKGLEDTLAAANAKSKWSLKINDGEAEEIGDGKVVTLKDGTNVSITKDAAGNYVFCTVAAPEFDAVTIRNTNISISSTGINMGGLKITNLQRGDVSEGSTDAVTGGQLYETNQRIDEIETSVDGLNNTAVKYDDETKSTVTLEGSDGTKISNVADGVDKHDAVNKGQLDSVKSELEGQISENVTNINNKLENIEGDITNLDDRVTKLEDLDYLGESAVTYDGDDKSSVTLKGEDGTKISNLADGTEDSDAVNLSQLNEVRDLSEANAEKIEEHSVYIENHEQEFKTLQTVLGDNYSNPTFNSIKIGNISSDGTNINMGGGIITGLGDGGIYPGSTDAVTGNQLWNAYKRMDDLNESINIVGAHAAAMSGLHPVPYNPYEPTTLSAAFGTYRDEYAVAVGVFHYVRSNLMFNLGASLCSDGDIMGRAGISIAVGPNSKKKPELARDMVTMQQIQVQSQYRIQELEAEIAALKQQITQITSISK